MPLSGITRADLADIEGAASQITIQGARYQRRASDARESMSDVAGVDGRDMPEPEVRGLEPASISEGREAQNFERHCHA